jgi:hypothetical protein
MWNVSLCIWSNLKTRCLGVNKQHENKPKKCLRTLNFNSHKQNGLRNENN